MLNPGRLGSTEAKDNGNRRWVFHLGSPVQKSRSLGVTKVGGRVTGVGGDEDLKGGWESRTNSICCGFGVGKEKTRECPEETPEGNGGKSTFRRVKGCRTPLSLR